MIRKLQFVFLSICTLVLISWLSKQRASSAESIDVANEYFLRGRYAESIARYEKLAEKNEKEKTAAQAGLLRALLITGQYEKVEELASRFLNDPPIDPHHHLFLGKSKALRGRLQEAQQEFEKALQTNSSVRNEAQVELALLFKDTGRHQESRTQLAEVYERVMNGTGSQLGLAALALQHLGRFKESNELFKKATRQDPNDLDAWNAWGNLFLEKYNPAVAVTVFADALKINPNHPESLLGMALSRSEGQGEQVQEILGKVLEINPNHERTRTALVEIAIETEAFDQAEKEIEACLKVNPSSVRAHSSKAILSYAKGQEADFREQVETVLGINPLYGEVFEDLGNYCVRQRLYKESVGFLRKATEINPRLWRAYSGLGVNLLRIGEEQAAKAALETSYENDPFNVWTFNTLRLLDSYEQFDLVKSEHFEMKLHKKESKLLQNYVPVLLEEAYQNLSSKYNFYPAHPLYFEMFPDHEDFAVRTLGVPGLGALGVCFGRGVVMDSPSARPKGAFNWGSTLWHEFAHVITLGITDHRVPRWFTEGISVMEEFRARPGWGDELKLEDIRAIQEKKLLPIAELNSGFIRPKFLGQIQLSYFQAGQACDFIDKNFGFPKILEMLQLFKAGQPLEQTLKRALNLALPEFDERFSVFLDRRYGRTLQSVDFKTLDDKELMNSKEKLEALLRVQPDNFFANLKLASYYQKEDELDMAVACLQRVKSLFPGYVETDNPYKQLSEIYRKQSRIGDAIVELQALAEINDSDFDSLKQLAQWLTEAQRPEEALLVLQKAMYVHPFDPETHSLLAELSGKKHNWPLALREYRALLALEPSDKATAHYNVATVLMEMGEKSEAKREVLAALEIAPGFEKAQELLLRVMDAKN